MTCPDCERYKLSASMWRNKAYEAGGTPLPWAPEELLRKEYERGRADGAAAEREKVAAWMIHRGYATGHGDTTEDLLKELDWQVLANWSSAMKTGAENEREACAKVCDGKEREKWEQMAKVLTGGLGEIHPIGPKECAAAIRARGKT